ncbi:hypothetical protein ACIHFD_17855 [Nonomuraea sp. NPDC051941]|uniref:hypothetical protein n=1 Tax=Nonomuraea sp. NPDC051941 TaxID=3364373 RepID=UPI0037C641E5
MVPLHGAISIPVRDKPEIHGFRPGSMTARLGGRGRRRETLGFGLGEVAALVTPVVWPAVDHAVQRIVGAEADVGAAGRGPRRANSSQASRSCDGCTAIPLDERVLAARTTLRFVVLPLRLAAVGASMVPGAV